MSKYLTVDDLLQKILEFTKDVGTEFELTGLIDVRLEYRENSKPYIVLEIDDER